MVDGTANGAISALGADDNRLPRALTGEAALSALAHPLPLQNAAPTENRMHSGPAVPAHAVARLRAARLARASKPFLARGGPKGARCPGCRLVPSHCLCALQPAVNTRAGMCLLMADTEPLKPSNTGWLVADVVQDTFAFGWARTEVDPALLTLLAAPQWLPVVVFPGEFVDPQRVVHEPTSAATSDHSDTALTRRPLFILLDGTWPEARKMLGKSPYLDALPVLSLASDEASRYRLRRSRRVGHMCTAEVAALCLDLAGEPRAAEALQTWLDLFTHHYLQAKHQQPADLEGDAHLRWRALEQ